MKEEEESFIAGECIKQHIWTLKWGVVKRRKRKKRSERKVQMIGTNESLVSDTQNGRSTKWHLDRLRPPFDVNIFLCFVNLAFNGVWNEIY